MCACVSEGGLWGLLRAPSRQDPDWIQPTGSSRLDPDHTLTLRHTLQRLRQSILFYYTARRAGGQPCRAIAYNSIESQHGLLVIQWSPSMACWSSDIVPAWPAGRPREYQHGLLVVPAQRASTHAPSCSHPPRLFTATSRADTFGSIAQQFLLSGFIAACLGRRTAPF